MLEKSPVMLTHKFIALWTIENNKEVSCCIYVYFILFWIIFLDQMPEAPFEMIVFKG